MPSPEFKMNLQIAPARCVISHCPFVLAITLSLANEGLNFLNESSSLEEESRARILHSSNKLQSRKA